MNTVKQAVMLFTLVVTLTCKGNPVTLPVQHGASALASVGNSLAVGDNVGNVTLFSADGNSIREISHGSAVTAMHYSSSHDILIVGSQTLVTLWNASCGKCIGNVQPQGKDKITRLRLSHDGSVIIIVTESTVTLVEVASATIMAHYSTWKDVLDATYNSSHLFIARDGRFDDEGGLIAVCSETNHSKPLLGRERVTDVVQNKNGLALVIDNCDIKNGSFAKECTIAQVDLAKDTTNTLLFSDSSAYSPIGSSCDGTLLCGLHGGNTLLLLPNPKLQIVELEHRDVMAQSFSPDGEYAVTTSGKTACVWNIYEKEGMKLSLQGYAHLCTFFDGHNYVALGGSDGVEFWSLTELTA